MIGHYLLMGWRQIVRRPGSAAINIAGLALGLAGCLLVLSYIAHERSWDRWLPEHERVFQVQTTWTEPGQPVTRSQASPYPVRQRLPADFGQVEAITVVRIGPAPVTRGGEPVFIGTAIVDPDFFRIFRLPFLQGSPATALPDSNSLVLTEKEAVAQFGSANALGRTLSMGAGEGRRDYRITGVVRDLPRASSLRFGMLMRNDPAPLGAPAAAMNWGEMSQQHYVRLRSPDDAAAINAALPAWEKRVVAPQNIGGRLLSQADIMALRLVPIADVHLGEAQQAAEAPGGDPDTLATFGVVAALTLVMAVINYVNLSTARGLQRANEIALRRLLGATRRRLIAQMLVESLLVTAIATLVALAVAEVAAPWLAQATGSEFAVGYAGAGGMAVSALLLFLTAGIAGGLIPALHLNRFRPGEVLRANKSAVETPGAGRFRVGLVLAQFAAAIGLLASTWVIQRQTDFLAKLDLGYRRDGLIQLDFAWRFSGDETEWRAASAELMRVPGIVSAGRTSLGLAATNQSLFSARAPGGEDVSVGTYVVDPGFFAAMDMRLRAGRLFDDAHGEDRIVHVGDESDIANRSVNVVMNEAAARLLELGAPAQAVGRSFRLSVQQKGLLPARVIGVVGDTRVRTPRDPLEPIAYVYDPARADQVVIRYASERPAAVMAGIRNVWRRFEPEIPFQGRFAEDILQETYAAERARGVLFGGFSLLAVSIAGLGLYGLARFATERRTKEIGIRKVLGAQVRHIVRLLVWSFAKPVVAANLLAWPIAWWAMRDWLNGFDAAIALTPGPFVLAGLLALAVALVTVSGHALRVARMNPIHALRYE